MTFLCCIVVVFFLLPARYLPGVQHSIQWNIYGISRPWATLNQKSTGMFLSLKPETSYLLVFPAQLPQWSLL